MEWDAPTRPSNDGASFSRGKPEEFAHGSLSAEFKPGGMNFVRPIRLESWSIKGFSFPLARFHTNDIRQYPFGLTRAFWALPMPCRMVLTWAAQPPGH